MYGQQNIKYVLKKRDEVQMLMSNQSYTHR
jgi:hypothetical protein